MIPARCSKGWTARHERIYWKDYHDQMRKNLKGVIVQELGPEARSSILGTMSMTAVDEIIDASITRGFPYANKGMP